MWLGLAPGVHCTPRNRSGVPASLDLADTILCSKNSWPLAARPAIGVLGAIINERDPIFSPNRNRLASPSSSSHSFLREAVPM
jgi:hypothetical protein